MTGHGPRTVVVSDVVNETADAVSLVLRDTGLTYRPGQFLTISVPSDQQPTARCYSLSSSPHVDDALTVTVKRTAGGYASNWLCDHGRAGLELQILPPAGLFTPQDLSADLLLCAGGSGITPVISILKSALAEGTGLVTLIYANRDEASVIFAAELAALGRAHPQRLVVHHWLESVQGLPSAGQLAALCRPHVGADVFVCGPAPFMAAVEQAMAALDQHRVHVERFVSLSNDPFALGPASTEPPTTTGAATASVHVLLDGQTHELPWPADVKLLDLLLASGLDAPYSCRAGNCSACGCKVSSGEVRMLANQVLEQQDLDEGWVLACQSLPVSDVVKVTYDD